MRCDSQQSTQNESQSQSHNRAPDLGTSFEAYRVPIVNTTEFYEDPNDIDDEDIWGVNEDTFGALPSFNMLEGATDSQLLAIVEADINRMDRGTFFADDNSEKDSNNAVFFDDICPFGQSSHVTDAPLPVSSEPVSNLFTSESPTAAEAAPPSPVKPVQKQALPIHVAPQTQCSFFMKTVKQVDYPKLANGQEVSRIATLKFGGLFSAKKPFHFRFPPPKTSCTSS